MLTIAMSNMKAKVVGEYKDLPLKYALLEPDIIFFAEFAEEIMNEYNTKFKDGSRISFRIDPGTLAKYDVPFDCCTIYLYRSGFEVENFNFKSNYMYTEFKDGQRHLAIDLYSKPEDYDSDELLKAIVNEIINVKYRDLQTYLDE